MTPKELSAWRWRSFEKVLRHVCTKLQPKNVLEWGPGRSTTVIRSASPESKILTIEHNVKYFDKVKTLFAADPNVQIVHRVLSMKGGVSTGYITYPMCRNIEENGGKLTPCYDLIFVDGRSRYDCLMTAWQLVKEDGIVILHDAHRANYMPAVGAYPHSVKFEEMRTIVMSKSPLAVLDDFDEKPKPNVVLSDKDTLSDLLGRFESGDPFTYLRFGDADLFFIDDPNFNKNRRHDANPRMASELKESFQIEDPDYLIGCVAGGKVFKQKEERLKGISSQYHDGCTYHSAVAFHTMYANDPDGFVDFVKRAFHGKRVLLIGGESIARNPLVRKVFNVSATIEMPDRNAYLELSRKMIQIEKNVAGDKFDIVVSALGQATRVLGYRLWRAGYRTQYFDVGSTVDALAERHLRSWIKRHANKVNIYKKIFMPEGK